MGNEENQPQLTQEQAEAVQESRPLTSSQTQKNLKSRTQEVSLFRPEFVESLQARIRKESPLFNK